MGEYTVEIVSKAEREFLKLPMRVRTSLTKKMLSLKDNPCASNEFDSLTSPLAGEVAPQRLWLRGT